MKRHNAYVIAFLKKSGHQELIDAWNSEDNQVKWGAIRMSNPNKPKRRCTCYILFCLAKRQALKEQFPYYSTARITSLLAKEWREHKEADDDVYKHYKNMDAKQVFFSEHEPSLQKKYPQLSSEEITTLLNKMYEKSEVDDTTS